eukprot:Awhi_evm1s4376
MVNCVKCQGEIQGSELEGHHLGCAECYICFNGFRDGGCLKDDQDRLFHSACLDKPKCAVCEQPLGGQFLAFEGKDMHPQCFCCSDCKKSLSGIPFGRTPAGDLACGDCVVKAQPAPAQPSAPKGVYTNRTKYTRVVNAKKVSGGDAGSCPRCSKKVYVAEKVTGPNGTPWHRVCFTCKECNNQLEAGKEATNLNEVYCKACYARCHGPKGY